MQSEPQLSAEMEQSIEYRAHKLALATALEKQRMHILNYIDEEFVVYDDEPDNCRRFISELRAKVQEMKGEK